MNENLNKKSKIEEDLDKSLDFINSHYGQSSSESSKNLSHSLYGGA